MSEDLDEEDLLGALADHDRELRRDMSRWVWWQIAAFFGLGAYALTTQGNWWCAAFALALAGVCYEHPNSVREANLDGYAAGWRRRRDDGRL